ncbi:MAG: hypothetical protein JNM17_07295 [Archangium sp.]|nr:hypothetical protein [Archangium sp.]
MCRECSARWVEDRCAKCRPNYGPSEFTERRMNKVKRCEFLRCDVCGLESPRLDRVLMPTWKTVLLSIFTLGTLGVLALLSPVDTEPMCPGCERSDELEPALNPAPKPRGFDEQLAEQRKRRTRALILGLLPPIVTLVVLAFVFVVRP